MDKSLCNLLVSSLAITLYNLFKQDMSLKSKVHDPLVDLGMRTKVVAFHWFRRQPEMKNSLIA